MMVKVNQSHWRHLAFFEQPDLWPKNLRSCDSSTLSLLGLCSHCLAQDNLTLSSSGTSISIRIAGICVPVPTALYRTMREKVVSAWQPIIEATKSSQA